MSFSQTFALSTTAAPGVDYIFIHVLKALPDAEIDVQPICMRRIFELLSVELGRTQYIRLDTTGPPPIARTCLSRCDKLGTFSSFTSVML